MQFNTSDSRERLTESTKAGAHQTLETLIPLKASQDQIYEYACHEGNYGMEGILRAARAKDGAPKRSQ